MTVAPGTVLGGPLPMFHEALGQSLHDDNFFIEGLKGSFADAPE
jgi:hypothetical protein